MSEPFTHPSYRSREAEVSQTPLYASVKRYCRHVGAECHAILGNLKWVFFHEDPAFERDFTVHDPIEAFSWIKSPQGEPYWIRVQKIMDDGRRLRNVERITRLKKTLAQKKGPQDVLS